ncbi:MAG: benzoyl-CoA reductase subunit B, partial [Desulfuromonadales bacterium]
MNNSKQDVIKSRSQLLQKEMIRRNYDRITSGQAKVSSTFVPGNLNELLMCFDIANNLPEINAIQNA